jgi:succinoglycan biosynthesis transport protein ExoP
MTFAHYLRILRARKRIVLTVLAAIVAAAVVFVTFVPRTYTATTSVIVDYKVPDVVGGGFVLPPQLLSGFMATQINIITSPTVALRVAKTMKLDEGAATVAPEEAKKRSTSESDKTDDATYLPVARQLLKQVQVRPNRDSSVLDIKFTSNDPQQAAALANAFAQAYMDLTLDLRVQPARESAAWFDVQTKTAREALEAAQAKLSKYQQEKGITATDEKFDTESTRLDQLTAQLSLAQAMTYEVASRQRIAKESLDSGGSPDQNPDVMTNPLVVAAKADLARLEARMREVSANYGKNHPQFIALTAEVEGARQRLRAEMRNVALSQTSALQVAQRREAELRNAVAAQKARVLQLRQERDGMAVLAREVESTQKAFDLSQQRLSLTNLESRARQTNVAVLTPAVEPHEPSSPRPVPTILAAAVFGLGLGIALAMLLELMDARIRSVDDIGQALAIPVLATIPRYRLAHIPTTLLLEEKHRPSGAS